jgi:hypothetical protein
VLTFDASGASADNDGDGWDNDGWDNDDDDSGDEEKASG